MRVLHWCLLGVTILLLVCEITVSQLCKSLITLVDGFHTLFVLLRMASKTKPLVSSLDSPASPPHASSSSAALPSTQPAESSIESVPGTDGTDVTDGSDGSDGSVNCGVSYTSSRFQPMGDFISVLILTSLCLSSFMEIVSFPVDPHPVQRPLLLVVFGAVSLLHKILVLWLNWDQLQDERAGTGRQPDTQSHLEVNHSVLAAQETRGQAEPGRVLDDVSCVQSAVDESLHNGALVLCNPGTVSVPDADSQTPQQHPEVHLQAAVPQDSGDCEAASGVIDLEVCNPERHSEDITEISKDNICMRQLDGQNASNTSPVCGSSHHTESPVPSNQWPVSLLSFILVIQGLCTSLLVLISGLVMLLVGPQSLHSSEACGLLVYVDPGLTLLAVIILTATVAPEVHRYGLLLLQATPPHICASDLGQRIRSVPGVQAVHDLHIWQLTGSFIVASVHVHCHAGFPVHRCADLMSGVTKVLQSVGVSCCTVQPEFASCSGSSAACGGDASPAVHKEDPSVPPPLICSLTCGKACAGSMCCSPLKEEPPAGETETEPQTLVIENTFSA
ncbi:uncharacterized protein LOC126382847 [Epinephelus moara]|uniref:uncharacterized protein LOC126382847 n=1 Tax=Epinephelus moara TaxID=300413 RepID=UPI00214EB259|nr:uncharacterized protein LOC126382847 [Epinephelus moara]